MCNCEEGKVINLNMGCCVPIVANANAYYTKSEIDKKIDDIESSGCCITEEEVDAKISAATEGKLDASAYTPTDLSNYYTKVETRDYVSGYTYDKQTIDEKVAAGGTFDPTQYYNKQETNSLLDNKLDASAYTPTDLSNYYNKQETNSLLDNKLDASAYTPTDLSNYATKDYVSGYTYDKQTIDDKVAAGGTFDPTQYYNKTQTNELLDTKLDASAYTPTDLSNYDTKSEVNNKISSATSVVYNSLTAHTANTSVHVTTAQTAAWDAKSNFSGSYNDLTDKPTIPTVPTSNTAFTNDAGYITSSDISGKADTSALTSVSNSLTAHTANTTVHVTQSDKDNWDSKVSTTTLNNYMLKSKIWCGTQSQYDSITTKDSETLYLIHS